jgi:hypothetical protein
MSSDAMAATPPPASAYPVRFDVDYPEHLSRLLNGFLFVKWLLALPVLFIFLLVGSAYLPVAAFFAILFRGKYPRWWFDYQVAYLSFLYRVSSYLSMLRDEYPALAEEQAVHFDVDYPAKLNNFLPIIKWILAIPHFVILIILGFLAEVCLFIGWVAIIFTGRFPRGLFNFVVGTQRWGLRVSAYAFYLLTDAYPPFSMK